MSPETARSLLQLPVAPTPGDVERAFRRLARERHPDHGGDPESFHRLVQARDLLQRAGPHTPGRSRAPVIVVHRGPWWRRLTLALLHRVQRRRNPPPPRVT